MSRTIYRRTAVSRKAWVIPVVLWVAAFVALLAVGPGGITEFNLIFAIIAPGMIFGIWLLTLWSITRYGSVTVTTELLRSGRDTVPIKHLHRGWLEQLALKESPTLAQRFAISANTFQGPGSTSTGSVDTGRFLGGGYAPTLGSDLITLQLIDGSRVSMQTRDREGLLDALLQATAAGP